MSQTTARRRVFAGWRATVAVLLIAVVATGAGLFLAHRSSTARACRQWQDALEQFTQDATALQGAGMARIFRKEAIARGWIDQGGSHIVRPAGCSP
ncbi:MAG TPA: hypothetical protein VEM93_02605 [Actinomycetota bacterium]|nr:hypothetical protein [Actinomycetota bacterium]